MKELKRHALNNTVLMAAALVIYFASLMLNNEGSRIFWILLPYMVVVFPCFLWNHGRCFLISFCRQQEGKAHSQVVIPEKHIGHMTCAQYEKKVRRPVRCSIAITVLGLFTSVANLIFLLKDFENLIFLQGNYYSRQPL